MLLFSSCDPEIDQYVPAPAQRFSSVQILDQISKKPVENAKVKLIRVDYISWSKARWTDIEIQYSNKDGFVNFSANYPISYQIEIYESDSHFRKYIYSIRKDKEVIYLEPK
jgi:5-hydroxyisourate hydrolase-like protein (transthyretin family)